MEAPGESDAVLSWQRMDIEQRLGFRGGKYTDVNNLLSLLLGILLCGAFYLGLFATCPRGTYLGDMFLGKPAAAASNATEAAPADPAENGDARGVGARTPPPRVGSADARSVKLSVSSWTIPLAIVFMSSWSMGILLVKSRKVAFQRRALALEVVPPSQSFVLAPSTAAAVLHRMYKFVDNPRDFVLLNRIERALSNLSNIGRVSDVIDMLKSQADNDEDHMESSYTIVRSFIWSVPVLGFIGTVLGLSEAIGGFGAVLSKTKDISEVTQHLKNITGGLATAFETTLQGLLAALCIQLWLASLRKKEEAFLDDCKEYCHANIVGRLRLIHLDEGVGAPETADA